MREVSVKQAMMEEIPHHGDKKEKKCSKCLT